MTNSPYNVDDFKPEAEVKRVGTIKITDVETGESTIHATYSAAEVIRLLDRGYSPATVASMLEKVCEDCGDSYTDCECGTDPEEYADPLDFSNLVGR